jgi:hypothetical protein
MPTRLVWSNQALADLIDLYVLIGIEQRLSSQFDLPFLSSQ